MCNDDSDSDDDVNPTPLNIPDDMLNEHITFATQASWTEKRDAMATQMWAERGTAQIEPYDFVENLII